MFRSWSDRRSSFADFRSESINIVQEAIIPAGLIQVCLHFCQLRFGFRDAVTLFVPRPNAPDMFRIVSRIGKEVISPLLSAEALLAVLIPVLPKSDQPRRTTRLNRWRRCGASPGTRSGGSLPARREFSESYGPAIGISAPTQLFEFPRTFSIAFTGGSLCIADRRNNRAPLCAGKGARVYRTHLSDDVGKRGLDSVY
jgi:hypothetical protein